MNGFLDGAVVHLAEQVLGQDKIPLVSSKAGLLAPRLLTRKKAEETMNLS